MSLSPGELEVAADGDAMNPPGTSGAEGKAIAGRSPWAIAWRRLRKDKVALAAGVFIVLLILVAVFADVLTKWYGVRLTDEHNTGPGSLIDDSTNLPKGDFGGMSSTHWLGVTPSLGQDILAMLIYGARTSLSIAFMATGLSLVLGVSCGLVAGYYRGIADLVISRVMDVLLSFPTLLLSLSLVAVVGFVNPSVVLRIALIVFVLGFFGFPYIGRIVRGQVLSLREKEFVDAARSLGASNLRIMAKEIAPNLIGPILVYTTLTIPNNMLGEAGLSYLGAGLNPPTASWGWMLSDAGNYFQVDPLYLVWPGLAIFLSVLAFNLFGDGLRDALDPKSTR